jgi:hypothetical protein
MGDMFKPSQQKTTSTTAPDPQAMAMMQALLRQFVTNFNLNQRTPQTLAQYSLYGPQTRPPLSFLPSEQHHLQGIGAMPGLMNPTPPQGVNPDLYQLFQSMGIGR